MFLLFIFMPSLLGPPLHMLIYLQHRKSQKSHLGFMHAQCFPARREWYLVQLHLLFRSWISWRERERECSVSLVNLEQWAGGLSQTDSVLWDLNPQGESLFDQEVYGDALESFTRASELQPDNSVYRRRR